MFHKVKAVKPLADFTLLVVFMNREQRQYDVKPLFKKWDTFLPLIQFPGLFEQVRVDVGGYGISWNDDIDLSCDELYYNGLPCSNKQRIILTSENSPEVAAKIKEISDMLMEKNKESYAKLAKMPK